MTLEKILNKQGNSGKESIGELLRVREVGIYNRLGLGSLNKRDIEGLENLRKTFYNLVKGYSFGNDGFRKYKSAFIDLINKYSSSKNVKKTAALFYSAKELTYLLAASLLGQELYSVQKGSPLYKSFEDFRKKLFRLSGFFYEDKNMLPKKEVLSFLEVVPLTKIYETGKDEEKKHLDEARSYSLPNKTIP